MTFFDVLLKIIDMLGLTDSEAFNRLNTDTKAWEKETVTDSPDKLKSLYAKLHKGVLTKLLMPFLYFFLLNWANGIGKDDDLSI